MKLDLGDLGEQFHSGKIEVGLTAWFSGVLNCIRSDTIFVAVSTGRMCGFSEH